jgi:hypothetical protein
MVLASFAAAVLARDANGSIRKLSRGELNDIDAERARWFPSPDDPLANYTTKASLKFSLFDNPLGFNDRDLRRLCTERNLTPPDGANTWAQASADKCAAKLLEWRNKQN